MNIEAAAALTTRLSRMSNRFEAGEAVCSGGANTFGADATVAWLPGDAGQCRAEDLFVAGDIVARASILDLAHAVRGGTLDEWFGVHGMSSSCIVPVGAADAFPGLLAVGWRAETSGGSGSAALLAVLAAQVHAVMARADLVEQLAAAPGDAEQLPVVQSLREDIERLHMRATELQRSARGLASDELRDARERTQSLLDEQMRLSQRGSAVLALTRKLAEESDAEAIYRVVLGSAERQMDGAAALLLDCNSKGPVFSIRAGGPRAAGLEHARDVPGAVAASFGPEIVAGPSATSILLDPRFGFDAALIADGVRAATLVPVAIEGTPQPVLLIAWPDARHRPAEDLWFIESLGAHLGLALKSARLSTELRQAHTALSTPPPSGEQPGSGLCLQAASRTARVLVVDDQADILETVADMIGALGYHADTAQGGNAALAMLTAHRYDMLLTDVGMPGMDGRDLARRAMASWPDLRVYLLTGWSSSIEGRLPSGVSGLVSKPVTMRSLRAVLDSPAGH